MQTAAGAQELDGAAAARSMLVKLKIPVPEAPINLWVSHCCRLQTRLDTTTTTRIPKTWEIIASKEAEEDTLKTRSF